MNEEDRFFERLEKGPKLCFQEPFSGRMIEFMFGYLGDEPFAIMMSDERLMAVIPRDAFIAALDGWGLLDSLQEQDFNDSQVFKDFINDIDETKED